MVYSAGAANMVQLEAEKDRRLAWTDDVYMGYLFVDMSSRKMYLND